MDRKRELRERFFNVRMPKWYLRLAWGIRAVCLVAIVVVAASHWAWGWPEMPIVLFVILGATLGLLLLAIPKAWIEQRNRLGGLRNGTMDEYVERHREDGDR